jgi:hypothetical protein
MLQHGVDAFRRGEGDEARRLLHAAIDGGAPSEEALALLGRLDRLEPTALPPTLARDERARLVAGPASDAIGSGSLRRAAAFVVLIVVLAAGGYAAILSLRFDSWTPLPPAPVTHPPLPHDAALPLPRRGDAALARARALAASGHLHDALAALDEIRAADPGRAEADRLRGDIQRQLLAVTPLP